MILSHNTLANYYQTNFNLMQYHKYSLSDIENLMPWEKFIYVDMLKQYIKHQEDLARDQAAQQKAQANIRRK